MTEQNDAGGTTTAADRAVRIVDVEPFFSVEQPSGTFSFGAATAGELTFAQVRVTVADQAGNAAEGWGAILLSHPWAFPGDELDGAAKDEVMRMIVGMAGDRLTKSGLYGHPLDHFLDIEPELREIAIGRGEASSPIMVPVLAALVAFSPIDAAIHDAYGNLHGVSSYDALGPDYVGWDLSRVLGASFAGRYLPEYLRPEPVASLPVAHTVGAADPLLPAQQEGAYPPLTDWIAIDGVHAFKVKLKGKDLGWDIARLVEVYRTATESVGLGGDVRLFGDLNEQGPSLEYILAMLDGVEKESPAAFAALDALEQPASRNLDEGAIDVSAAARRVPIVLDEGLTSLEAIDRAVALGWNGIALKTCKTQSLMLLALAKASALGLHISVQDLTNPGIALLQSVGLAARLPQTAPLESNQRQYFPATSKPEAAVYPTIYAVHGGTIPSGELRGPGLGYGDLSRIGRDIFA